MQLKLLNRLMILNCTYQSFLKKYQPFVHLAAQLHTKFVITPGLRRLAIKSKSSLNFKSSFRNMSCCGNSCGMDLSKEALKKKLTSIQYQVTQEKDTERAFTGKYCNHFEKGTYMCVVCSQDIFSSEAKFDSKCGWPAFSDVVDSKNVSLKVDLSHVSCNLLLLTMKTDMKRTEVNCSKCGAHLGHVFDDGPKPTGKRYCINSAALDFKKFEEASLPDSTTDSVPKS